MHVPVIEDSERYAELVSDVLSGDRTTSFAVTSTTTLAEGDRAATETAFDMAPLISASHEHTEPLRHLAVRGAEDRLRVVHHDALERGEAFIEKPFTQATLLRRLTELLDGCRPGDTT